MAAKRTYRYDVFWRGADGKTHRETIRAANLKAANERARRDHPGRPLPHVFVDYNPVKKFASQGGKE